MAADLIIYAIIAAVLVFWLHNILGTKTGEERERQNPFTPPANDTNPNPKPVIDISPVVPNDTAVRVTKTTLVNRVKIETPNAELGLKTIAANDQRFTLDKFMEGAEAAFEIIVTAFARGDKAALQPLLTATVYNDFARAIDDRIARGETINTRIIAVHRMDIISAELRDQTALIAVRFTAEENCITRNAMGTVISGDPVQNTTMVDIWTFGRDITSSSPIWHLFETRDEHMEDHKTPMPESYMA